MTFLGMPGASTTGALRGDRPFPDAAHDALADTQLRRNLGKATATIRAKRAAVVGELPDWEQLRAAGRRDQGRRARPPRPLPDPARTAGHARAAARCTGRATRTRPTRIVTDWYRPPARDEVVKVKSMATQEIGLNEALEAAGITATETDLAELIVQLGHDRPSHILVPAIHRNRAEIREIFLREMPGVDPGAHRRAAPCSPRRPAGTCAASS